MLGGLETSREGDARQGESCLAEVRDLEALAQREQLAGRLVLNCEENREDPGMHRDAPLVKPEAVHVRNPLRGAEGLGPC